MECGGQCVMTAVIAMMVQLSADNWVTESAQVELIYLTLTLFVPILISDFTWLGCLSECNWLNLIISAVNSSLLQGSILR